MYIVGLNFSNECYVRNILRYISIFVNRISNTFSCAKFATHYNGVVGLFYNKRTDKLIERSKDLQQKAIHIFMSIVQTE